jgi:hypothetical protein
VEAPASIRTLYSENAIGSGGLLRLQEGDRDIVHGHPGRGFSIQTPMMSVAMDDQIGSVAVDDFCQT